MSTFSNRRILQSAVLPSIGFYDSASPERCDEQCTTNDEAGSRMNYVGSRFEGLPLGQGLPSIQMQDRWNTSLDGWETDVADVVAHLTSAIATIAGHVAKPSDKVVDLMFLELDEAGSLPEARPPRLRCIQSHRRTAFRLATLVGCS